MNDNIRNLRMLLLTHFYIFKGTFSYRLSSVFFILATLLNPVISVVIISSLYAYANGIAGWNYFQLLALSAFSTFVMGMALYLMNPDDLSKDLKRGKKINRVMLLPLPMWFVIFTSFSDVFMLGSAFGGLALFLYAISHTSIGLINGILFVIAAISGIALVDLLMGALSLLAFKFLGSAGWTGWLFQELGSANSYPLTIYGSLGLLLFSFALPIGLAIYFPASILLGKFSAYYSLGIVVISVLTTLLLYRIFKLTFNSSYAGGKS